MAIEPLDISETLGSDVTGANSSGHPVDLDAPRPESNAYQVDPDRTCSSRDTPHMRPLGGVDSVDRITLSRDRPHLDSDTLSSVQHQQVDLSAADSHVAIQLDEPAAGQPPGSESLTRRTDRGAADAQSLSSVFSSFSTFTSRNVRT